MGTPFTDITLYAPTAHKVGTPEYWEDVALQNFVSDLYLQKMHGYKPPKTSRVSIQPEYYNKWERPWMFGSVLSIAPYFSYDDYCALDKKGKYQYILDLIQASMLQSAETFGWDKAVFEKAYEEVVESDFAFQLSSQPKLSRDKKKAGYLLIEKTETVTSIFVVIEVDGTSIKQKLFDKKNSWWYDAAYTLAKNTKWFANDRFGIKYNKGQIEIWYSIEQNTVTLCEEGNEVKEINFKKFFLFQ